MKKIKPSLRSDFKTIEENRKIKKIKKIKKLKKLKK